MVGAEAFGDGQHAFVRVDGDNRPAPTHTSQRRTRDHAGARADIKQVVAIACGYGVQHRFHKLANSAGTKNSSYISAAAVET